jgi:hypothetical protein
MPSSTEVLGVIVLVALAFLGGLLVGRHTASGQTSVAAGGPQGFPTPGGAAGASGTPGGFTAGTVTQIDGNTLYLETVDEDMVEVVTTGDTQIRISQEGTLADLSRGATVVVQGSADDRGVIEADRVSVGDLGLGGGPIPGAVATGSTSSG